MDCQNPGVGTIATALSEERRQHLEHIQLAIARMASASARAKTWFLPVTVAALGYSITALEFYVSLLAALATALFAALDSRYLREERAFRALYQRAAQDKGRLYDMNSRQFYGKPNGDKKDRRQVNCQWNSVFWSWTVAGFYIPAFGVAVAVGLIVLLNVTGGYGSLLLTPPAPSPSASP